MPIKTLLVCLTTETSADTLMDAAVKLARRHNAHLIGLHTIEALLIYPEIAMHVPSPAFAEFNKSQRQQADDIKRVFDHHTKGEDFVSEWRLVKSETTTAVDRMIESARAADLVLVAQADAEHDRGDQYNIQEQLIRESGRPVVVLPQGYDGPVMGDNIVLGWSATREATRAAHDVTILTQEGSAVSILRIGAAHEDELADDTSIELAEAYARIGLKATVVHREQSGERLLDIINREAREQGADLIAAGAFGHTRAYDIIVGAATRDLLNEATLPVLFSR